MSVKDILMQELSKIEDDDVGLLLSGGNGSASLLYTLLDLGKCVHAYTFHMEDHNSTDLIIAKELCKKYNVKHTTIPLSSDIEKLKKDCLYLVNDLGCKLKTHVECCFPLKNTLPLVEEKFLIYGMGDDNHFCISKQAILHYSDSIENMDKWRRMKNTKSKIQGKMVQDMADGYDIEIIYPYLTDEMCDYFEGKGKEINDPKIKQSILDSYPKEFKENRYYHAVFQKGDSKISDNFLQLLDSNWNLRGYKRTDGIYNSIRRGELPLENEEL